MSRKIKNTLGLVGILLFIVAAGSIYSYVYQKGKIKKQEKQLSELRRNSVNTEALRLQLEDVKKRAMVVDSVLSRRKFIIPKQLTQTYFFDFVNKISFDFSQQTHIDVEFKEMKKEKSYNYFAYKVSGVGDFNDIHKLLYGIEHSKELKKIKELSMTATVQTDKESVPHHLVNFNFIANIYFADDGRFSTTEIVENELKPKGLYNVFYPLIRNELPPNTDDLPDVTGAKLLAIVPDGAFISDTKGQTYMLMEGDPVYLGYLTKIDYDSNQVTFILNKGGIIEKVYLKLEKEENRKRR
ncbi:MAG: hypothetical protein ACM3MI_14995 [Clostridiales bacterium]